MRVPTDRPLREYLAWAIDSGWLYQAVPAWQMDFELVRLVKAHRTLARATPGRAFREVDSVVRSWGRHSKEANPWRRWFGMGREDAEAVFLDCWDKVRYLPGFQPLDSALEMARRQPLQVPKRYTEGYALFVGMAGWLQVARGDRPIMLPVEDVGALLGVTPMTVSRYRRWAKETGILVEVREARFGGKKGAGEATEFRFRVELWPCLRERARGSAHG
jgi:hypothetical protein